MSNLDELLPRFSGKLDILGVSLDRLESTSAMATELNLRFPIVIADNEEARKGFKMIILPALFCIDEAGILRNYYTGEHSLSVDAQLIEDFISSSNAP